MTVYTSNLKLHSALGADKLEDALLCLREGESLIQKDQLGWTPFHVIARNNFTSFFTHPNAQKPCASHPLVLISEANCSGQTPLDIAAAGRLAILSAFMKVIVDANLPSEQYAKGLGSALCSAASDSDNDCFNLLLSYVPSNFNWREVCDATGESIASLLVCNASTTNLKSLLNMIGMPLFTQLWQGTALKDQYDDPFQFCLDAHSQSARILNQFQTHPLPEIALTGCDYSIPTLVTDHDLAWDKLKI